MTDTDQGAQAANLGGQLRGGQPDQGAPQQGPPQNPYQIGGRNPWQMAVDLIRPPQGQPGIFSGERQDPTNTTPQNYIPAQRRSDHTMWGKDDAVLEGARRYPGVTPGPFMPYGQAQLAQVFHESAAGLANIGSGAVGPLGMQSAAYQTAFIKARMQKQEWEARMNQIRMREAAQKLEDEQRKESLAYGEIFAEYGDNKDKLKEALREHAMEKVGGLDQPIITALENGGADAAKRVLQERDYYYLGLAKTNQQRKDEDTQREREDWHKPAPAPEQTARPTMTPPPPVRAADGTVQPAPIPTLPPAPPRIDAAARDLIMDRKPRLPRDPQTLGEIEDRQNEVETRLDQLPNNPAIAAITDPAARRKAVVDAVRGLHPELANDLTNYLDGVQQPPVGAAGSSGHWSRIISLAQAIDPTLTPDRIKTRTATLRDFTSGNDGRNLSSIGTAFRHMRGLQQSLAGDDVPNLWNSLLGGSRYTSWATSEDARTKMGELDARVSTALSEYERALLGGKPTQAGRQAAENLANWRTRDLTVIRSSINTLMEQLRDRLQEQKDRFVAGTGGKANDMLPLFERNLGQNDPVARAGLRELDAAQPQIGARKQFKQGWGVWDGTKWVPEK